MAEDEIPDYIEVRDLFGNVIPKVSIPDSELIIQEATALPPAWTNFKTAIVGYVFFLTFVILAWATFNLNYRDDHTWGDDFFIFCWIFKTVCLWIAKIVFRRINNNSVLLGLLNTILTLLVILDFIYNIIVLPFSLVWTMKSG